MNLRREISTRFGREKALQLARYVVADEARMAELMGYVLGDDKELSKYSSWLISHSMHLDPTIIRPYVGPLIHHLAKQELADWTVRCIVKALAETDIPEPLQGHALQHCFDLLLEPKTAVAIQVHAMQVIFNISKNEPDLLRELREVIEERMPQGTAGFQSRGRKILREIGQVLRKAN